MTLVYTYFILSKMSLREPLFFDLLCREIDLVLTVLCLFFFSPTPIFFVPTTFANVLSFLRPLTTCPTSGAAISSKSAPILFAAGTIYFLIKWIADLP